ncbi:MAG: tetratricopeptide repeat protein, partial [Winogradskyella arenosi]
MNFFTKYTSLFLFVFCGLCGGMQAQDQQNTDLIDSLSTVYSQNVYNNPRVAKTAALQWLEQSKALELDLQVASALYALGNLGNISGDYQSTLRYTNEAITLLKSIHVENGLAACYNILASGYKNLGRYPEAMDSFIQCLNYAEKTEDKSQEANAYQNIATLYLLQKDYKKSAENLDRAANLYREIGDDDGVLTTLFNYANILKEEGKYKQARKHYKTVLKYREKEGNKAVMAYVNINLAQMLVQEERCEEAVVALRKTLNLLEALHFNSDLVIVLNDLGLCESKLGHRRAAISAFERALKIGEDQALLPYNSEIYKNLALLYEAEGNYKNALKFYQKGVLSREKQNSLDKEKYVANIQEGYETQLKETRI